MIPGILRALTSVSSLAARCIRKVKYDGYCNIALMFADHQDVLFHLLDF